MVLVLDCIIHRLKLRQDLQLISEHYGESGNQDPVTDTHEIDEDLIILPEDDVSFMPEADLLWWLGADEATAHTSQAPQRRDKYLLTQIGKEMSLCRQ